MPLVRLQVRNEYGLGRPVLYKETNREDPKAVLDGVAVAGLVGILRQLGDLADFAAEVFHDLQEQVLITASRSHKLMLRAQNIEASLPPLEKTILAQTSHIHFAYTAGCKWHCRTKTEQNPFIYNDLPQFIMDSYEECRDPPCLHLLDKFDTGGPGSCLRRYSDPTFFKRVSAYSDEAYTEKIERVRETSRSKKKRSSGRNGEILQGEHMYSNSGRMQFASHVNGQTSSQTASTIDVTLKSDVGDHSNSYDSRAGAGYIECVFQPSNTIQPDEQDYEKSPSSRLTQKTDTLELASPTIDYNFSHDSFDKQTASTSIGLTWNEKEEMVEDCKSQPCDWDETPEVLAEEQNLHMHEDEAVSPENIDHSDTLNDEESNLKPVSGRVHIDEIDSEPDNYLDALNTIESESENDLDYETKREVEQFTSHVTSEIMEDGVDAVTYTVLDHNLYNVISQTVSGVSLNKETDWDFLNTLQEIPPLILERQVTSLRSPVQSDVPVIIEGTKISADSHDSGSSINEQVPDTCGSSVLVCTIGTNRLVDAQSLNDTMSASIETVPSDVPFDKERTKNFVDSHVSESPICEQEHHVCGNSVLDCSLGTNPFGNVHTLNDTASASVETDPSDDPINIGRTKNLADSYASENPICEQVPHICGNSVLDCSVGTNIFGDVHNLNDTVSASVETVPPDVLLNLGRTNNLADSHASESPIHDQVPCICGNSVLDCSVGANPVGIAHTLNDTLSASIGTVPPDVLLNLGRTESLADSHASESSILEQVPHIYENSVLDCSVSTIPVGDAHTLIDTVSASVETVPPDVLLNSERTNNLAYSHASESLILEQVPHMCGNSVLDCSVGTNPLGDVHTLNDTVSTSFESDISSVSESSDLPDKEADGINSNICKYKETPSESASDPSVGLWTNGGLLGLEPSKPPDFIMSSSLYQRSSISGTAGVLNDNSMLKSNGFKEEQDLSAEIAELNQMEPSSRCLISNSDDQTRISGKTSDCHQLTSGFSQNDEEDLDINRVQAAGTVLPVAQDAKTAFTEPNKGSGINSPLLFGLGHKLLINSFRRKVSFDEKSGPDNPMKTGILEQSGQNSIVHQSLPETTFKEQVSYEYPICSPPPSPPLEHMKISFHPVKGFETFKLKLKFPDGSNHRENTRDMFPSFRLVPEPSIPLHDSGSNSDDDDTFCRSSLFVSDDCLSPHSDDDSDQWESDDTPGSGDHGICDSSLRDSSTESKLSSQEIRGMTNVDINLDSEHSMYTQDSVEPSLSGPLLVFPSFDTVNSVLEKECNKHSDYNNNLESQSHAKPIPPAPPLPPKQWWVSSLQLDRMNEKQDCTSEDTGHIGDPNISEPILQPRLAQVEQNLTDREDHEFYDNITCKLKDKLEQQKLNEQKKENQVGIGKDIDEKEVILYQISTKSFNLKHTVTGKPNTITSPTTTTDKVTAILEKANAICQAIASEDGEDDDSWSDT